MNSKFDTAWKVLGVAGVLSLTACGTENIADDDQPEVDIDSSHKQVMAGERVTFEAESENILGMTPEIEWRVEGADLEELENGRVAQVTFDEPGTYNVDVELMVDGRRIASDRETVTVRPANSVANAMPQLKIKASNKEIIAGERVTLEATSANTLGRNAQVEWRVDGGDLREMENGRMAQITFDEPGTYTVFADLMVDGKRVQTAQQKVTVKPVR